MTNASLVLLMLLAAGRPAPKARAPEAPTVATPTAVTHTLADGSSVLVVPTAGSGQASFRWVVGAGASHDPSGKAGLAHLLEHLLFHGTYDLTGLSLEQSVRAAGGTLNAYTMAQATVYVLDAPKEAFPRLVGRFLRCLTNPALSLADLRHEREVIEVEVALTGTQWALKNQMDAFLFPSLDQTVSVGGSRSTRADITLNDLLDYYAAHYRADNTTAVFTGDVDPAQAMRLVEEASCLPPRRPARRTPGEEKTPRLPVEIKARAGLTFAVYGYVLDRGQPEECRAAAGVLERRLLQDLVVTDPVVSAVQVGCTRFRGSLALLATTFSTGLEASNLSTVLRDHFEALAETPPPEKELKAVRSNLSARRGVLLESPSRLADQLSLELIDDPERELPALLSRVAPEVEPTPDLAHAVARRSFVPDRRIFVLFSPFDGDY